jgi:hypothetical protein
LVQVSKITPPSKIINIINSKSAVRDNGINIGE